MSLLMKYPIKKDLLIKNHSEQREFLDQFLTYLQNQSPNKSLANIHPLPISFRMMAMVLVNC